jgi:hypothetical protein
MSHVQQPRQRGQASRSLDIDNPRALFVFITGKLASAPSSGGAS